MPKKWTDEELAQLTKKRLDSQPWARRFSPRTLTEFVGNERTVRQLKSWTQSWGRGIPKQRAAFLYGPSGTGKTCSVVALANDLGYDLFEVNASDFRTKRRLEKRVGRAALQTVTITGKRRMILFDELEGISARGVSAITAIIEETRVPVILVATSVGERWEEKFRPLVDLSLLIEFEPVPFGEVLRRLRTLARELDISVDEETLEFLAGRSQGDLRSSINDLEAVALGRRRVTLADVEWLGDRDRKDCTPDALMKMFSAKTLREARSVISSTYIGSEDLFDWINENLPIVLNDPEDLTEGLDALSRADIHRTRARKTRNHHLVKYAFNDMTGGVALSRHGSEDVGLHELVSPQLVWHKRRAWYGQRRRRSIAERLAKRCHISTRKAIAEMIPLLKVIYKKDRSMSEGISSWLDLDEEEAEWLRTQEV